MVQLSVNVNKVATLRNARGGRVPDLLEAIDVAIAAGSPGITVHPRLDERHITADDLERASEHLRPQRGRVEFNVEGDPRPDLMERVLRLRPNQCTLVPVKPGEVTSEAGWPADTPKDRIQGLIGQLRSAGIRVSVFVEAKPAAIEWAHAIGADRIELYTEPYARAFERGEGQRSLDEYRACADLAHSAGLGINAGHDLDLENLPLFATLPHLDEVSIGHALMARALFVGLDAVVREYLTVLEDIR